MNWFRILIFLMLFANEGVLMAEGLVVWPKLESIKFITGRAATESDVTEGRAVFVMKTGGTPIGHPLPMTLPQYAIHVDGNTKHRTPCILIQAEEANGQKLGGCRLVSDGSLLAAFINEFELLGSSAPK